MPTARFRIEVPRGSLVKWGADGGIDFLSPIPCPFNYGSLPAFTGADGDPLDVVVLGERLPRGATGALPIRGRVRFIDAGQPDDKWICAAAPLRRRDRLLLQAFFRAYAVPKAISSRIRRGHPSRFVCLEENPSKFLRTDRYP